MAPRGGEARFRQAARQSFASTAGIVADWLNSVGERRAKWGARTTWAGRDRRSAHSPAGDLLAARFVQPQAIPSGCCCARSGRRALPRPGPSAR